MLLRTSPVRGLIAGAAATLLFALTWSVSNAQVIPVDLETTVGSGENLSYFVLDFKSGPSPESYAFGYRYTGTKTGTDLINALVSALGPNFQAEFVSFPGLGSFATGFGYDGKFINASTSPAPDYWSYWGSPDGLSWAYPGEGSDLRQLSNGSWDGWSYDADFNDDFDPGGTASPTTPLLASSANAPEPGTLALLTVGSIAGFITRRRRAAA